eukprot:EG_transcript_13364
MGNTVRGPVLGKEVGRSLGERSACRSLGLPLRNATPPNRIQGSRWRSVGGFHTAGGTKLPPSLDRAPPLTGNFIRNPFGGGSAGLLENGAGWLEKKKVLDGAPTQGWGSREVVHPAAGPDWAGTQKQAKQRKSSIISAEFLRRKPKKKSQEWPILANFDPFFKILGAL